MRYSAAIILLVGLAIVECGLIDTSFPKDTERPVLDETRPREQEKNTERVMLDETKPLEQDKRTSVVEEPREQDKRVENVRFEADKRAESIAFDEPKESRTPKSQDKVVENMMFDAPVAAFNHSQCVFKPEDKLVSCRVSPVETVECSAVCDTSALGSGEHKNRYNVYGIGLRADCGDKCDQIESKRYWLYPRKLDNTTYLNHSVVAENGKRFDTVVGCGENKFIDVVGLRVNDCRCYERLVRVFEETSKLPQMVRLESGPAVLEEVGLVGEILVLDKSVQKRWLYGYGFGLNGLYGWGGLGLYGYPWF